MEDCIFCKIVKKEVPSDIIKETDNFIVFPDINPQAAIDFLIAPKKHISDIFEMDDPSWIEIKSIAQAIAKEKGFDSFRLVHNAGAAALVPHMHVHLLAGVTKDRKL
jgi:histidine triad (HIT) family protein